jgi:hypothetical protein
MSAKVIPFRDTSLRKMLASRRTYREGCKQLAAAAFAEAFSSSLRQPSISQLYLHDATSIFVAAMRRELKRVARGTGRFELMRP